MSEVKIVRYPDKGLDFKRIEKIESILMKNAREEISELKNRESSRKEELKNEALEHFNLTVYFEAIKSIEIKISELKDEKREYEKNIRKYTKKPDYLDYGQYDKVDDGSLVDEFIKEKASIFTDKISNISKLAQFFSEKLWLSKDTEETVETFQEFNDELFKIKNSSSYEFNVEKSEQFTHKEYLEYVNVLKKEECPEEEIASEEQWRSELTAEFGRSK